MMQTQQQKATTLTTPIRITKAALADWNTGSEEKGVLRGVIDAASLSALKIGAYQRGLQSSRCIQRLVEACNTPGGLPAIELGMRGTAFAMGADGEFFLNDDVYIIDGLQRTSAALEVFKAGKQPRLGCVVHFRTDEEMETRRFEVLNMNRTSVSPSMLVRNLAQENDAVKLLVDLGKTSEFPLYDRVSWGQRTEPGHLVTGEMLLKITCQLHRRVTPGLMGQRHAALSSALLRTMHRISQEQLRENVLTFWQALDQALKIRDVQVATAAPHLKFGFLRVMASLFAEHQNFWRDQKLVVSSDLLRKLASFPISDPTIAHLCGVPGTASTPLYLYLVDHINFRKRTGRLRPFDTIVL